MYEDVNYHVLFSFFSHKGVQRLNTAVIITVAVLMLMHDGISGEDLVYLLFS